jgi:hypothetical protein
MKKLVSMFMASPRVIQQLIIVAGTSNTNPASANTIPVALITLSHRPVVMWLPRNIQQLRNPRVFDPTPPRRYSVPGRNPAALASKYIASAARTVTPARLRLRLSTVFERPIAITTSHQTRNTSSLEMAV